MQRRISAALLLAACTLGLLVLGATAAGAVMEGDCTASFNGIHFDDLDTPAEARQRLQVQPDDELLFRADLAEPSSYAAVDVVFGPTSFELIRATDDDPDNAGVYEFNVPVDLLAQFGQGIYEVRGRTDTCVGNAFFVVGDGPPWSTPIGVVATAVAGIGLLAAAGTSWLPGLLRGGGGWGRSLVFGAMGGFGGSVMVQQAGVYPLDTVALAGGVLGGGIASALIWKVCTLIGGGSGGGGAAATGATGAGAAPSDAPAPAPAGAGPADLPPPPGFSPPAAPPTAAPSPAPPPTGSTQAAPPTSSPAPDPGMAPPPSGPQPAPTPAEPSAPGGPARAPGQVPSADAAPPTQVAPPGGSPPPDSSAPPPDTSGTTASASPGAAAPTKGSPPPGGTPPASPTGAESGTAGGPPPASETATPPNSETTTPLGGETGAPPGSETATPPGSETGTPPSGDAAAPPGAETAAGPGGETTGAGNEATGGSTASATAAAAGSATGTAAAAAAGVAGLATTAAMVAARQRAARRHATGETGDVEPVLGPGVTGPTALYDLSGEDHVVAQLDAGDWYLARATYDEWVHVIDEDRGIEGFTARTAVHPADG